MESWGSALCASAICMGMYGLLAGGAGWLAHWRMVRVERDLGRPAVPSPESAQLLYAGASVVWLSAAVIAAVGFLKRDWSRVGRNAFFLLLAHFALAVLAALAQVMGDAMLGPSPGRIVVSACGIVLVTAFAASAFVWRWGALRILRVEAEPPSGDPPGPERYAIYVGSVLVGMVGFIAAFVYKEPQNVRVGVTAARISMVWLLLVVVAVCVGMSGLALYLG